MTLSTAARRQMDTLLKAQPETKPWLAVLSAALEAAADPVWDTAATDTMLLAPRPPTAPLLAGARIPVAEQHAVRWVRRVLDLAGKAGTEGAALRAAAKSRSFEALALLEAAINADEERLGAMSVTLAVDQDALMAVAAVAAMPLLQALRRRFAPEVDRAGARATARSAAAGRCWLNNAGWSGYAGYVVGVATATGLNPVCAAPIAMRSGTGRGRPSFPSRMANRAGSRPVGNASAISRASLHCARGAEARWP